MKSTYFFDLNSDKKKSYIFTYEQETDRSLLPETKAGSRIFPINKDNLTTIPLE